MIIFLGFYYKYALKLIIFNIIKKKIINNAKYGNSIKFCVILVGML